MVALASERAASPRVRPAVLPGLQRDAKPQADQGLPDHPDRGCGDQRGSRARSIRAVADAAGQLGPRLRAEDRGDQWPLATKLRRLLRPEPRLTVRTWLR